MQNSDRTLNRLLTHQDHIFLAIATGLVVIHLTLTSRANDGSLMASSILYWMAVASFISSKRESLQFRSNWLPCVLGLGLISLVLLKSTFISGYDPFLRIFPLLSVSGLSLFAIGFRGLGQCWQALLALCFLTPPPSAMSGLVDISAITATFSASLLWYLGADVSQQGVYIMMPTGGVEVYSGCSGIENIVHLLGLSMLFLMLFETRRIEKVLIPVMAVIIAFVINGIRVALMAFLAASPGESAFEYWHKGDGSLLFSMIAVMMFGLFCLFLMRHSDVDSELSEEEV